MASNGQKRLYVSVIEPVGGHGGMDYYDFGMCEGLANAGVVVTLYTSDKTEVPKIDRFQTILSFKGVFGDDNKWIRGLRYVKAMVSTLVRVRFSKARICHFHYFHIGFLEFCQTILAKALGLKVAVTAHDVEPLAALKQSAILSRKTFQIINMVIVHNQWSKNELVRQFGEDLAENIRVIPHGHYIDIVDSGLRKAMAREKLNISLDKKVLLFFGQIKKEKGLDLLLEALEHVRSIHPDVLLVIAGKVWKDDYTGYANIIAQQRLSPYCMEKIGYVPNSEVPYYFSAADMVVLPYRRIYQSGVLLMAMSYGKAVLVSDLPAMTEIVREGVTGFTFEQGDVRALSEKLTTLLSDPVLLQQVAQNATDVVRRQHNWNAIGGLTASGYESLFPKG